MPAIDITGNSAEGFRGPAQNSALSLGRIQGDAQRRVPREPNNGNPRGANNMGFNQKPGMGGASPSGNASQGNLTLGGGGVNSQVGGNQQQQQRPQGAPQTAPPMPNFGDYEGVGSFAEAIRRYNTENRRDRFDPGYGVLPSDSANWEDRQLMGLEADAYAGSYNPDGSLNMAQLLQGRASPPPLPAGYNASPQGYWNQGQNPAWGRYMPPMMQNGRNPMNWYNQGGYNYNLPGAGGFFPNFLGERGG